MSKRLEILKQSLVKKEEELQRIFDVHFATVKLNSILNVTKQ